MPHVFANGCDTEKIIQQINIHAEIVFRNDYFKEFEHTKCNLKLKELQDRLDKVLEDYFDDVEDNDPLSNHEYNLMKNNY